MDGEFTLVMQIKDVIQMRRYIQVIFLANFGYVFLGHTFSNYSVRMDLRPRTKESEKSLNSM